MRSPTLCSGFAAEYFHRRVLRFPLWQQAAQVAVLLGLCMLLVLLVRTAGGAPRRLVVSGTAWPARCCGR